MKIKFYCSTCEKLIEKEHPSYREFPYAGYADEVVLWSDEKESIPTINENGVWLRSDITPNEHDKRVVCISRPFSEDISSSFWVLYCPSLANLNGWEEHPEEIERSAFVKCKIDKLLEIDEIKAWAKVEVLEVIRFDSILATLEATDVDEHFVDDKCVYESCEFEKLGDWIFIINSSQGDCGNTMLIKIDVNDVYHLVCYTEHGFHCSPAFVGNLVVDKETVDQLANRDMINT